VEKKNQVHFWPPMTIGMWKLRSFKTILYQGARNFRVELCVCSGRILQVPWLPFKCLGRRWKGGTLSYKITSFYNSSHSLTSRLQEETCNGATWTVCVTCTK
jgi:hypothetical protein